MEYAIDKDVLGQESNVVSYQSTLPNFVYDQPTDDVNSGGLNVYEWSFYTLNPEDIQPGNWYSDILIFENNPTYPNFYDYMIIEPELYHDGALFNLPLPVIGPYATFGWKGEQYGTVSGPSGTLFSYTKPVSLNSSIGLISDEIKRGGYTFVLKDKISSKLKIKKQLGDVNKTTLDQYIEMKNSVIFDLVKKNMEDFYIPVQITFKSPINTNSYLNLVKQYELIINSYTMLSTDQFDTKGYAWFNVKNKSPFDYTPEKTYQNLGITLNGVATFNGEVSFENQKELYKLNNILVIDSYLDESSKTLISEFGNKILKDFIFYDVWPQYNYLNR